MVKRSGINFSAIVSSTLTIPVIDIFRRKSMVQLREITKDNLDDVVKLEVSESQEGFVASTTYALAQAWVYKETAFPFAIYADDVLVGFIMLGY